MGEREQIKQQPYLRQKTIRKIAIMITTTTAETIATGSAILVSEESLEDVSEELLEEPPFILSKRYNE